MTAPVSWRMANSMPTFWPFTITRLAAPYVAAIPNTTSTAVTIPRSLVSHRSSPGCRIALPSVIASPPPPP